DDIVGAPVGETPDCGVKASRLYVHDDGLAGAPCSGHGEISGELRLLELRSLQVSEGESLDAADRAVTEVDDRAVAEELDGIRAARASVADGLAADEVATVELINIAAPAAV